MGSRNPQDINPDDVYPAINLPDDATPWARAMQDDMIALKKGYLAQDGSIAGVNRYTASAMANMAAQINALVEPVSGYANGDTYVLPTGRANRVTRATFNFTVPAGFTRALISASAQDIGVNSTAGIDYLSSFVEIGAGGPEASWPGGAVAAGYRGASCALMTTTLTGLTTGQTIAISSQPFTFTGAWASDARNATGVIATCLWLR